MGRMIDGRWVTDDGFSAASGDRFVRAATTFRHRVTASGGEFPAQPGRYHLYVSYACPWAHRTLIARALHGLEDAIAVSVVSPLMYDDGWTFAEDFPGATADRAAGHALLREVYAAADPHYTGRVTVPVLFDTATGRIVNNESSDILRIFDQGFAHLGRRRVTLAPDALIDAIDAVNARVYTHVNNGVYKCGFARSQAAYDEAFAALFDTLAWLDARLGERRFLVGDRLTEADVRLFTTLVRFDAVYVGHFKCNLHRIADTTNLSAYLRDLFAVPAFRDTTRFDHIKHHYYRSHASLNPSRIVPGGPALDLDAPHDRDRFGTPGPLESLGMP